MGLFILLRQLANDRNRRAHSTRLASAGAGRRVRVMDHCKERSSRSSSYQLLALEHVGFHGGGSAWFSRSRGRLSSCIWNLAFFSERCTEKLPLRVDFIHRVEFGVVSGHRVLLKRGPGNRGPTECGTTLEATSGMSS